MSKRLQVLFGDDEFEELRETAERSGLTVSEWVRQALRRARREERAGDPARKLAAVRAGLRHEFPSGEIEDMLDEIERGYTGP